MVLSLFLIFSDFEPRCSYKIVLIKKRVLKIEFFLQLAFRKPSTKKRVGLTFWNVNLSEYSWQWRVLIKQFKLIERFACLPWVQHAHTHTHINCMCICMKVVFSVLIQYIWKTWKTSTYFVAFVRLCWQTQAEKNQDMKFCETAYKIILIILITLQTLLSLISCSFIIFFEKVMMKKTLKNHDWKTHL